MLQYLKLAIKNITQRKLRSWLTIIGVIIGIAAIVSLISISNGMEHAIKEQFEQFGTDMITVTPANFMRAGTGSASKFTDKDIHALESIAELKHVVPIVMSSAEVEFHNQKKYLSIFAYKASSAIEDIWDDFGFEVDKGRFPQEGQGRVVGLGYLAAKSLFDEEIHVRNNIYINSEKFKVVGIAKEIGNSEDDNSIFMPLDTAQEFFNKTDYDYIMAIAKEGINVKETAERVERRMERVRDEEDYQVMTASEIIERVSGILSIIQLVLVGIAAISLLVGAVGIMNTMYTSVLERTKEIGIMKAVGATNRAILSIFLIEAGIIGVIGGLVGALFGTGISQAVAVVAEASSLPLPLSIRIEWSLIAFSVVFAFGLGALSGFLPARSAAKMKPADSLRFE